MIEDEGLDHHVRKFPDILTAAEVGRLLMKKTLRVVICGLARDLGALAPLTTRRIDSLASMFEDAIVVIHENDSKDGTAEHLRTWAALNSAEGKYHVETETMRRPRHEHVFNAHRMADMAYYRDRMQKKTLVRASLKWCTPPHYAIQLDTDYAAGWSWRGLESVFAPREGLWDVAAANGIRFAPNPRPPWDLRCRMFDTAAYRDEHDKTNLGAPAPQPNDAWMPVTSAFGGFCVYRWDAWAAGRYLPDDAERAAKSAECEHVGFHRTMHAAGFRRHFIAPPLLACHGHAPHPNQALSWTRDSVLYPQSMGRRIL